MGIKRYSVENVAKCECPTTAELTVTIISLFVHEAHPKRKFSLSDTLRFYLSSTPNPVEETPVHDVPISSDFLKSLRYH